jgi:N-acetylmuramoyl-L-alanine amidase
MSACFLILFAPIAGFSAPVSVVGMTYAQEGRTATLTLKTSRAISHARVFLLQDPLRLVVDIDRVNNATVTTPTAPKAGLARTIRFGHFSPTSSRIVLELSEPLDTYRIQQVKGKRGGNAHMMVHLRGVKEGTSYRNITASSAPEERRITPPPTSKKNITARASSGTKRRIVIDAGHGGKDPGAMVGKTLQEKDITLAYALALKRALLATGRYNVTLTRADDTFILLSERVRIAREAKGDVMVSLHADIAPQKEARGLSVYTVSEEASDKEAATLARTENEVDKIGAIDFADEHPDVADILIDLATRDTRIKSTDLAFAVSAGMKAERVLLLKNPNRYAGFRVLKSPDVPSILIELGFLSNTQDAGLLQTASHRASVVQAVVSGLDAYFVQHPAAR